MINRVKELIAERMLSLYVTSGSPRGDLLAKQCRILWERWLGEMNAPGDSDETPLDPGRARRAIRRLLTELVELERLAEDADAEGKPDEGLHWRREAMDRVRRIRALEARLR